jgi:RNA polymerase sigma-70 factor (ECF subfamily)
MMHSALTKSIDKDLPDAELARRIAAGDEQAFTLLMRRHNQALYRTARSIVKDDAEAEDVVQDTYLLAYRGIDKYRGEARLLTWLTRIAVNEAIMRTRKAGRRAEIMPMDGNADWENENAEVNMAGAQPEQPERAALRAEARDLIEKKIDALPEAFRTVFVLRALEEMTVEETAACLGIPEATVRSRYFRARSILREALSRELDIALEEAFSFAGERCDRIVAGVLGRFANMRKDA